MTVLKTGELHILGLYLDYKHRFPLNATSEILSAIISHSQKKECMPLNPSMSGPMPCLSWDMFKSDALNTKVLKAHQ